MSKQRTAIQKAIERSRALDSKSHEARNDSGIGRPQGSNEEESGVFRISRAVRPDPEAMERSRIVAEIDDAVAVAAYKMLRTRVLQRMRGNNWRSLIVTSSAPGEGKTLTSANLALSIARDVNQSVLLVDLDLRRSALARYFGIEAEIKLGIGDYLQSKAEISDIIYTPIGFERISIIPNRDFIEHSSELLGSPRMKDLLAWTKQQSDRSIVVFDMPPVLAGDDVLAICPEIDAVLMVAAQGMTDRAALRRSVDLLSDANLIGVILNRSDEAGDKDSYGYY